jgi:hypothetical protein
MNTDPSESATLVGRQEQRTGIEDRNGGQEQSTGIEDIVACLSGDENQLS